MVNKISVCVIEYVMDIYSNGVKKNFCLHVYYSENAQAKINNATTHRSEIISIKCKE